ncbi:hypothetical protein AB6A23_05015 [Paenibacillus tarimensis]
MKLWLSLLLLFLPVLALYFIYRKRQENESILFIKLIGYMIMGGFTFAINGVRLPAGFVIYLVFFTRPKRNKTIKQWAALLGLLIYAMQLLAPSVQNYWFERPRSVVSEGDNLYSYDFESNWSMVQKEFDINYDARLEKFEVGYEKDGLINELRYEFLERELEGYIYYRVKVKAAEQASVVERQRIEGPWFQYDRSAAVSRFFEQLNAVDLRKIKPGRDFHYYILSAEGARTAYAIEDATKYILRDGQIIEITNSQLPIEGYWLKVCGAYGDPGCSERTDYFFDATYNNHKEEVVGDQIKETGQNR